MFAALCGAGSNIQRQAVWFTREKDESPLLIAGNENQRERPDLQKSCLLDSVTPAAIHRDRLFGSPLVQFLGTGSLLGGIAVGVTVATLTTSP